MSDSDSEYYTVEKILDHRDDFRDGKPCILYKVKWEGYDESECTWEPDTTFNATALLLLTSYKLSCEAKILDKKRRKRGKTINEIVMKTMDRQLQTLENEMGRLKRRRAKLISLLDPLIPHLEPVKTNHAVSGNVQKSVQSRVSLETPKSSEKFLPKLKEEPGSPIFFIGNNQSDDDVTDWRDYVDDVEIPQVNIQRVEKLKTPRIPRKKKKQEKSCLKSAKKRKADDSEKVNSTKKRKTVPTIKKKPIVPEKTQPSYAELMDQLNAEKSFTVVQTDIIF